VTVRLWRLGLLLLAVLLAGAFLLGRSTALSHASGVPAVERPYDFAQGQADELVIARSHRGSQRLTARATATSHVRWAIPDVELYNADNVPGSLHDDPDAVSVGPVGRDLGMSAPAGRSSSADRPRQSATASSTRAERGSDGRVTALRDASPCAFDV